VVFYVLLFSTDQWKRLVPTSWEVFPNAISTALQYLSLDLPQNEGFATYNALQLIAYFITVFIAAPVALVTGLLQACPTRSSVRSRSPSKAAAMSKPAWSVNSWKTA
jgi:thiosulfate reductase cytochrome b subunit